MNRIRSIIAGFALAAVLSVVLAPALTCAPSGTVPMPCHAGTDMTGCCCATPGATMAAPCDGWCDAQEQTPSARVDFASIAVAPPTSMEAPAQPADRPAIPTSALVNHPPGSALTPLRV